jgi:hypothetical protein
MSPKTIDRKTNSGTEYKVAEENQVIKYKITSGNLSGKIDGENDYWNVYIPASEIQNQCFPLNANPRQPNSIGTNESTDIVVKMRKTLKTQPSDFVRFNNGFTCVCTDLKADDPDYPTELEITWGAGEGILNGGHTYLSIHSVLPKEPNADVRVEFIVLSKALSSDPIKKKNFIKDTAIARNSNRQLQPFTQAEFEGKHDKLKSHLGDLKSSIYFSEGFEDLNKEMDEKSALAAKTYVAYLSTLDRAWHWHPSKNSNPKGKDVTSSLLVKGVAAYDTWKVVALDEDNEMNLSNVAPFGPVLLKIVDSARESMRLEKDSSGKTKKPVGYGNKFTLNEMWNEWAGKGQKSPNSVSYYDVSGTSKANKLPRSSPHYINWVLNYIRPFLWFGEADDDCKEYVGWHRDPIQTYTEVHKAIIKKTLKDFKQFKKYGSFVTHESTAKIIWDEVIEPIWSQYCSLDFTDNNFFPTHFFSPFDDEWFAEEPTGDLLLVFNTIDEEWRTEKRATAKLGSSDVHRAYEQITTPY